MTMTRREFLKSIGKWSAALGALCYFGKAEKLWAAFAAIAPIEELQKFLGNDGVVVSPSDPSFQQQRRNYNRRIDVRPLAIAFCKTAEAVSRSVSWAQDHAVPLRIRGGGHCYEDSSLGTGLVLDVTSLNKTVVDARGLTVTVGGGTRLEKIQAASNPLGLTLPGGSCPSVGVGGLSLGGGYGLLARKWGLTCDHLVSLQLVDAAGRLHRVNEKENSDLFWACRGGGGNFGIVTEFVFQLRPVTQVATFSIQWERHQAAEVLAAWQAYAPQAPDEVGCHLTLAAAARKGITVVRCGGQVVGKHPGETPTREDVLALLKPLTSAIPPRSVTVRLRDYASAVRHFSGDARPVFFKAKSDIAMAPLSREGIQSLIQGLAELSSGGLAVLFDPYGGAIARIPSTASAFPHRAALYCVQYYSEWSHAAQTHERMAMLRRLKNVMQPYFSGLAYANYADAELPHPPRAYYADNLDRLCQIKNRYDPTNAFNLGAHGILAGN